MFESNKARLPTLRRSRYAAREQKPAVCKWFNQRNGNGDAGLTCKLKIVIQTLCICNDVHSPLFPRQLPQSEETFHYQKLCRWGGQRFNLKFRFRTSRNFVARLSGRANSPSPRGTIEQPDDPAAAEFSFGPIYWMLRIISGAYNCMPFINSPPRSLLEPLVSSTYQNLLSLLWLASWLAPIWLEQRTIFAASAHGVRET